MKIDFENAYYIKLGDGGSWEKECINSGVIRLGYSKADHDACISGDWETVREKWIKIKSSKGAATRDVNQIRIFYTATSNDIFVTFHDQMFYWCHPAGNPEVDGDRGGRIRKTVNGWSCKSIGEKPLSIERLSGDLIKTRAFRGTICAVESSDYLKRKINDVLSREAESAEKAERELIKYTQTLIERLTWKDFEVLVDLIFANSGWRRIGAVGGTQADIDIDLLLPITRERAFVQIKSKAKINDYERYRKYLKESDIYQRMFFVWHTGNIARKDERNTTLIGPERIARLAIDAGLSSWLREKAL